MFYFIILNALYSRKTLRRYRRIATKLLQNGTSTRVPMTSWPWKSRRFSRKCMFEQICWCLSLGNSSYHIIFDYRCVLYRGKGEVRGDREKRERDLVLIHVYRVHQFSSVHFHFPIWYRRFFTRIFFFVGVRLKAFQ